MRTERRAGIAIYLTVGFPDLSGTLPAAIAAVDGGADIIELGVPFSDPLADGATIQRSSSVALGLGVNLDTCLAAASGLRAARPQTSILLMGYYNPFLHYGLERLADALLVAGIDGLIVPDLPPEEAGPLDEALAARGLDLIFLLAPTSGDERVARVAAMARGFVYCVSLTGITGARPQVSASAIDLLDRVRQRTSLPLALGFGISDAAQVRSVALHADAVVIGSAFIDLLERSNAASREEEIRTYVHGLSGATRNQPTTTT